MNGRMMILLMDAGRPMGDERLANHVGSFSLKMVDVWRQKKGLDQGDHSRQCAPTGLCCRVVRPDPAFLGVNQTSSPQELEMVTDGGLILLKLCGYVADAQGSILLDQEIQHPEACRITHCLQPISQRRGLSIAETWALDRNATRLILVANRQLVDRKVGLHASILA